MKILTTMARSTGSLAALGLVLAGCGSNAPASNDAGSDSGIPDAPVCNGSIVPAHVTANMTLTKTCSPWRVAAPGSFVSGSANPVLTIEAGVTVELDDLAFLSVGVDNPGGIMAVGTSTAPIVFTSSAAAPTAGSWASVSLGSQVLPSSEVAFANFSYGGAQNSDGYSYTAKTGSLMVFGDKPVSVAIHDVTLAHNAANGLVLDGTQVTYATGSGNLMVNDWGNGDSAFVISADAASSMPTTLAAGSNGVVDLICGNDCQAGTAGMALVDVTQQWPAIPIPYLVDGLTGAGLMIEGSGSSVATLTITAPNTLQFKSQGALVVDPNGSAQANLVAVGTASNPITFTSSAPAPNPAAWHGIKFVVTPSGLAASQLVDCDVDYAGGTFELASTIQTCSDALGAVWVSASLTPGAGPTISGCSIQSYPTANYGIITNGITTSSTYASNTFGGQTVCNGP
jgi:hypothetical protein